MNKNEKIELAIFVVLLIILIVNIWAGQIAKQKTKINCETACFKIDNDNWTFPGVALAGQRVFFSKEECVSACQARFRK